MSHNNLQTNVHSRNSTMVNTLVISEVVHGTTAKSHGIASAKNDFDKGNHLDIDF